MSKKIRSISGQKNENKVIEKLINFSIGLATGYRINVFYSSNENGP